MGRTYSAEGSNLQPGKLSDNALLAIGRLVRAFAEIDNIAAMYLCDLANIDENLATVMIGRATISSRIAMAGEIAKTVSQEAVDRHMKAFGGEFQDCLTCRNAVAHGHLLGIAHGNLYAFLTDMRLDPREIGSPVIKTVISYSEDALQAFAEIAENGLPKLIEKLELEERLEARLQRRLLPHRKASRTRDPSTPKPQRGSSRKNNALGR